MVVNHYLIYIHNYRWLKNDSQLLHITNSYNLTGFSTDGKFNSLRSRGKKRPISVIEVIRNAKSKARQIKAKTLTNYDSGMYFNKFVRLTIA